MLHILPLIILFLATLNHHVDARSTGLPQVIRRTLESRFIEENRIVAREKTATKEQDGDSARVAITQDCSPDQLKSQASIGESGPESRFEQLSTRSLDYEDLDSLNQKENSEATLPASELEIDESEGINLTATQEFPTNELALDPIPAEQPSPKTCPSPGIDGYIVSFVEFDHESRTLDALHQGILLTRIQNPQEIFLDLHREPPSPELKFRIRQPFHISQYDVKRQKMVGFIVPRGGITKFVLVAEGVVVRECGNCQHWVADALDEVRRVNAMLF